MMKSIYLPLLVTGAIALSGCEAHEETVCTSEPESLWMDQQEFQDQLKAQGYRINEFKVTDGQCYEIYGYNNNEQKVEIYFNPVTGAVVKEEIE